MAIYNAIQERGLNRLLQQRLTMLDSAPAPALVPEIGAQLVLETDRPEWRRWKDEIYISTRTLVNAVALEYGSMWIPAPTGRVIVIEQLDNAETVDVNVGWRATIPAFTLPAINNPYARDNSFGSAPMGITIQSGTSVAIPPFDNVGSAILDRVMSRDRANYPIVLWPGGPGLLIRCDTVNTAFRVLLRGYTRTLLPNELG